MTIESSFSCSVSIEADADSLSCHVRFLASPPLRSPLFYYATRAPHQCELLDAAAEAEMCD